MLLFLCRLASLDGWGLGLRVSREGKTDASLGRLKFPGCVRHYKVRHRPRESIENLHDGSVDGFGRTSIHPHRAADAGQGQDRLVKVRGILDPISLSNTTTVALPSCFICQLMSSTLASRFPG